MSQDAYHAIAGKIERLLKITFDLLNDSGKKQFVIYWRRFEKPSIWHYLPNPVTHLKSFMFSDALQLVMIMPFILKCFLVPDNIILAELAALGNHLSSVSNQKRFNRQVINNIISY